MILWRPFPECMISSVFFLFMYRYGTRYGVGSLPNDTICSRWGYLNAYNVLT